MYGRDVAAPRLLLTGWTEEPSEFERMLRSRFDVHVRGLRRCANSRDGAFAVVSKRTLIVDQLRLFARLLVTPAFYAGDWRFVCGEGHYAALLFARVLRVLGRRPPVYLVNFYLHGLANHALVRRILAFLLTDQVRVLAQTRRDGDYFAAFLEPRNIIVVPYRQGDPFEHEDYEPQPGSYVFSGGWTNRDYDALLRVAARLPEVPFAIVASARSTISEPRPANVRLRLDLPQREFHRLLAGSAFVVVPLREDVGSSGQMVVLAGMAAGKAVIAPRVGAVDDYVADGETGRLYPLGDDEALLESIRSLIADPRRACAMGQASRARYERRFTDERTLTTILEYVSSN
jgi:glycosyltransferase involved in cell wall biosynthesis